MKTEIRIWFVVFNTATKMFLWFEEDGSMQWTPSVFGADKCSVNMHYKKYVNTHTVILKVKETIEPYN